MEPTDHVCRLNTHKNDVFFYIYQHQSLDFDECTKHVALFVLLHGIVKKMEKDLGFLKLCDTTLFVLYYPIHLKTLDTIGNCQRAVFSLGVFQHMNKIINL